MASPTILATSPPPDLHATVLLPLVLHHTKLDFGPIDRIASGRCGCRDTARA